MRLLFGEDCDKFLEICDISAKKEVEQFVVAVTWLWNVDNVFSLRPRDTPGCTKLVDKRIAGIDVVQQVKTIDRELAHPSFV